MALFMYVFLLNKISFFSLSRVCNKFQMHSPTNKIITQQLFRHLIYSTDFDITCLRFIVIKIIELLRCKCILEMPECVCLHNKEFDDIFHHKWLSNTDQFNAFIYGLQFWLFKKKMLNWAISKNEEPVRNDPSNSYGSIEFNLIN